MKIRLVYTAVCSIGLFVMSGLNGMENTTPRNGSLVKEMNSKGEESFIDKMFESYQKQFETPIREFKEVIASNRLFGNIACYISGTSKVKPFLAVVMAQVCGFEYCYFSADELASHSFKENEWLFGCIWRYAQSSSKKLMIIIDEAEKLFPRRERAINDNQRTLINFALFQTSLQSSRIMVTLLSSKPAEVDAGLLVRCGMHIQMHELRFEVSTHERDEMLSCMNNILRPSTTLLQKILELYASSLDWPTDKEVKDSFQKIWHLMLVFGRIKLFSKDMQHMIVRLVAGAESRPFFLDAVRKNRSIPLFLRSEVLRWLCDCTKAQMITLGNSLRESPISDAEIAQCVERYFGPCVRQEGVFNISASTEDNAHENLYLQDEDEAGPVVQPEIGEDESDSEKE